MMIDKQNTHKTLRLRIILFPFAVLAELFLWVLALALSRLLPNASLRIVSFVQTYLPNWEWYFAKL